MHHPQDVKSRGRRSRQLLAAALAGGLLAAAAGAGAAGDPAAKPASSCVACHTDVAKLQEEAKGIPIPTGSALQSGKG